MRESQWYVIRKLDVQICLCFIEPVPLLVVASDFRVHGRVQFLSGHIFLWSGQDRFYWRGSSQGEYREVTAHRQTFP